MPPHERCREPTRLTESSRHGDRLGRQLAGTLWWLREDKLLGQPRKESHAQDAVSRLQRREGLLEQSDVGLVRVPGSVEPTARAEHGPSQPAGGREPAGELERLHERRARVVLIRSPASGPERQQHVASRGGVVAVDDLQGGQRALVVRLCVLVGVGGLRRLGRPQAVDDRLPRSTDLSRLEVVMRELRRMHRQRRRLQRHRHAPVEAHAAARDRPLVERLAYERVGEREAVDLVGILEDHPCCDSGLQRRDEVVLSLLQGDRLQRRQTEIVPQHGSERQDVERRRGQPIEAPADHVLDAFRHGDPLGGRRERRVQQLLDEERISARLLEQSLGTRAVDRSASEVCRGERDDLRAPQAL